MIIKTNVSSMWICCLITINVGCEFWDRGSIRTYVPDHWILGKLANLNRSLNGGLHLEYTTPLLYKLKENKYGQYVSEQIFS